MAATRRHFCSWKPVWDLAGIVRQGQQAGELTIMSPPIDPSRDLLFGLLALQNGLINQAQLVAAFQAWTLDKARALADHLISLGHLDDAQRAAVEVMADLHVAKHYDLEKSLAAIPAGRSTCESLERIGDPDIERSLSRIGSGSTEADPDRTATYSVGIATSDGQRFRVLRPHARGGLGAVFVALDTELHREVALKQILESHADDETSRARFLLEAEITGGLEHPGIVPVYGLGTYGDGRPYYAMRFIRGDSLKEAIDRLHAAAALKSDPGRRSLELRKLLHRFTDVCNAIEYAHSRGVLHRDLKPGNIIVGKHGETLVVDWGLAKATGRIDHGVDPGERVLVPSSASGSAETLPGSALGTPAYMSPEQAEGDLEHLSPRSDVYSLGATLYYLLTGRPPVEGDIGEVIRAVQRGEFPPPRQLDPTIDRALEAVCLKAMALKPSERYGTPKVLADDIERWMADEPVTAWREPVTRRARRWARRNRTAMTAVAVALVAGVVGLGAVAGVGARANYYLMKSHEATRWALGETRKHEAAMSAELAQSKESRQRAEAVSNFLIEAFRSPDPSQDGRQVKASDVLDRAGARLDKEFAGSQALKGMLLDTLGTTYRGLGLYDRAVSLLTQAAAVREVALGPDHPDTLATRNNLAIASYFAGRLSEAIALHEGTLKRLEAKRGSDHLETLNPHPHSSMKKISVKAKLGSDHLETLNSLNNLANACRDAGWYDGAIALDEAALKRCEAALGPDHPQTLKSRNNLADAYLHSGRTAEAIGLLEGTLDDRDDPFELASRPFALASRVTLASAYESLGRWSEAEDLYHDVLARRRKYESTSPQLADDLAALARNLLNQRRWSEAEPLSREGSAIRAMGTPNDWLRYDAMSLLGGALLGQGRCAEAEPLVVAGYEGMEARELRIAVPERVRLREAAERVIRLYEEWNKPEQATAWKAKLGMPDLPAEVFARP
jgi:serine/threonine protein kinase/tetratricopeptide (TPR) repeat protein